jgi:hypothetical protein
MREAKSDSRTKCSGRTPSRTCLLPWRSSLSPGQHWPPHMERFQCLRRPHEVTGRPATVQMLCLALWPERVKRSTLGYCVRPSLQLRVTNVHREQTCKASMWNKMPLNFLYCSSFNTGYIRIQIKLSVRKQVYTAYILCSLPLALRATV